MNATFEKIVTNIFTLCGDNAVEHNGPDSLATGWVINKAKGMGYSEEEAIDGMKYLAQQYRITFSEFAGGKLPITYSLPLSSFDMYARKQIPDYHMLVEKVTRALGDAAKAGQQTNNTITDSDILTQSLGLEKRRQYLLLHILRILENRGDINAVRFLGGPVTVISISPELK
jgi:hypothetical protein